MTFVDPTNGWEREPGHIEPEHCYGCELLITPRNPRVDHAWCASCTSAGQGQQRDPWESNTLAACPACNGGIDMERCGPRCSRCDGFGVVIDPRVR